MEIRAIPVRDFDGEQVFNCGQAFRWRLMEDGWWLGVAFGKAVSVRWEEGNLYFRGSREEDLQNCWMRYFDLERDYTLLKKSLSRKDSYLKEAVSCGRGIRILKQEPFETLISFIISANNNIPRIRGCIERLAEAYGELVVYEPDPALKLYAFPTPDRLAALSPEEISLQCHTGYRSAYIIEAARQFLAWNGDLSEPCRYRGVGPKVAACIELFTGMRTDSFPVDVWVRRVLEELYFDHVPTDREIREFVPRHFGKMAGYAQQYLFYWRRVVGKSPLNPQDMV